MLWGPQHVVVALLIGGVLVQLDAGCEELVQSQGLVALGGEDTGTAHDPDPRAVHIL